MSNPLFIGKIFSTLTYTENMPLDKMSNPEQFIPTHKSIVLSIRDIPVACIIDTNPQNETRYLSLENNHSLRTSLMGFLNKDEELGLLIGFKLGIQTNDEFFEYTAYPDGEFVDAVILNESIFIINEKLENLFALKGINTDQFVKTKSEFEKFKKILNSKPVQ